MHKRTASILITGACLSLAFLAVSQEAGQDKTALQATVKARAEHQARSGAEKARILAKVNRMSPSERQAALFLELKNSTVLQEARNAEAGKASTAVLARAEQSAKSHEILTRVNQLPVAERQHALREALKEVKGKDLAPAGKNGSAPSPK
ncbi:MAG: hypothetical protein ACREOO_24780 [bacterium]